MYIHIHTYTHSHIHTYIHTYTHIHTHTHIYIHTHIDIYTHTHYLSPSISPILTCSCNFMRSYLQSSSTLLLHVYKSRYGQHFYIIYIFLHISNTTGIYIFLHTSVTTVIYIIYFFLYISNTTGIYIFLHTSVTTVIYIIYFFIHISNTTGMYISTDIYKTKTKNHSLAIGSCCNLDSLVVDVHGSNPLTQTLTGRGRHSDLVRVEVRVRNVPGSDCLDSSWWNVVLLKTKYHKKLNIKYCSSLKFKKYIFVI